MKTPGQVLIQQPQVGRRFRRPAHPWNVRYLPWQLQPVFTAPVLPGETLKNALFQMRTVSDPVSNRLIGWWHEFYLYYVPLLSMGDDDFKESIKSLLLDPGYDPSALLSATAHADTGFNGRNQINWTKLALDAIVAKDFRNENELGTTYEINGLPAASINPVNWTQSMLANSEMTEQDVSLAIGGDDEITAAEVEGMLQQYEMLKTMGLVEMSYEDYLKTFGVRGRVVREDKAPEPELLRYKRDFAYPANTVDATGAVNSALSWSVADRADKDRFFSHPGFLIGVEVARPKVYMSNLTGQAAHAMLGLADWLPAVLRDDPLSSLKQFAADTGPLGTSPDDGASGTQGYWVDMRDLFLYGDQFTNSGTAYEVALPSSTLERRFAVLNDAYALFSTETNGTTKVSMNHIETDGICNLSILGAETDHTAQRSTFTPPA